MLNFCLWPRQAAVALSVALFTMNCAPSNASTDATMPIHNVINIVDGPSGNIRRIIWSGEMIRKLRETRDYRALLSLVFADYAAGIRRYRDVKVFNRDLALLQESVKDQSTTTIDPDLNPTAFRELLEQLRPLKFIDAASLNKLIATLDEPVPGQTDEDVLLPQISTASKAKFDEFLRTQMDSVYVHANSTIIATALTKTTGMNLFPPVTTPAATLLAETNLPSEMKRTLTALSQGTIVDSSVLLSEARDALQTTSDRFNNARSIITDVAKNQDLLNILAVPALGTKAKDLVLGSPEINESFDVLIDMTHVIPMPEVAKKKIQQVGEIGSAIEDTVSTVSEVSEALSDLNSIGNLGLDFLTTGGFGTLAGSLGSVFGGGNLFGGESDAKVLAAVQQVSAEIQSMHHDMDARFDRVDSELANINKTLDVGFANIDNQLKTVNINVLEIVSATGAIEQTLLAQSAQIDRIGDNELAAWDTSDLQQLHTDARILRDALRIADAEASANYPTSNCSSNDFTICRFRDLSGHFRDIANVFAAQSPLDGLQAGSESYNYATVASRLDSDTLFSLNYLLSFHNNGPMLSSLLPTPYNVRDFTRAPLVNERAWEIAANGLAAMIERWPGAAREIPRSDYDAIMLNGRDLQAVIADLGSRSSGKNLMLFNMLSIGGGMGGPNEVFSNVLQQYTVASRDFAAAMQAALSEEVMALGPSLPQSLSPEQINAVANGLRVSDPPNVNYLPSSVAISSCNSENINEKVSSILTPSMYLSGSEESLAAALNIIKFGGCLGNTGFSVSKTETVDHDRWNLQLRIFGLGNLDQGDVCIGRSDVQYDRGNMIVPIWASLKDDPDDPAHRYAIGTAYGIGPEAEWQMTVNGTNFRWSGASPNRSDNHLNTECGNYLNGTNYRVGLYVGNQKYYQSNWNAIYAAFSPVKSESSIIWTGIENNNSWALSTIAAELNRPILQKIYSNLLADGIAIIDGHPQSRLSGSTVAAIINADSELLGTQAMLRTLTLEAFEQTMKRDDVLRGLLFGSNEVPNASDLATFVENELKAGTSARQATADLVALPKLRQDFFVQRLQVAEAKTASQPEGHEVLDLTMDRLTRDSCLVPKSYTNSSACDESILPQHSRDRLSFPLFKKK